MIERVHLRVRDIAASRAFYRAVLGVLGWGEAELQATGAVAFGPGQPDAPGWVARLWLLPTPAPAPVGSGHVAVAAGDKDRVIRALAAVSGVRGQVVLIPPLAISAYLEDPDGHFLEATAPISCREAATFTLLSRLPGVRIAGEGATLWLQGHDRSLVTLTGESPCEVKCGDTTCVVSGLADLVALDRVVVAARALDSELTVHRLIAGQSYRVLRDFTDYYDNAFLVNERLTFVKGHFLPYHDGHTLVFRDVRGERRMYIQGGTELYGEFGIHVGPG